VEEKIALSDLEKTIAQAFRLRGKSRLNRTEFTFVLAYDLKWFTPEESKELVEAALTQGLLKEEGGKLIPAFNFKNLEVPKDFKPGKGILNEKNLFDATINLIETTGLDRVAILRMVDEKEKQCDGLITRETAALIIAKARKLNIEPFIDDAYSQLLENKD
jgi:hypothetical protein